MLLPKRRHPDGIISSSLVPPVVVLVDNDTSLPLQIRVGDFDLAKLKGALRIGHKGARNAD